MKYHGMPWNDNEIYLHPYNHQRNPRGLKKTMRIVWNTIEIPGHHVFSYNDHGNARA